MIAYSFKKYNARSKPSARAKQTFCIFYRTVNTSTWPKHSKRNNFALLYVALRYARCKLGIMRFYEECNAFSPYRNRYRSVFSFSSKLNDSLIETHSGATSVGIQKLISISSLATRNLTPTYGLTFVTTSYHGIAYSHFILVEKIQLVWQVKSEVWWLWTN